MPAETVPPQDLDPQADVFPERIAFEAAQRERTEFEQQSPIHLSARELILGLSLLVLWFGLFSGGILIATEPYRKTIETPTGNANVITSWVMVCLFWTITNIGVLSCVSAFLGALGRRTRFTTYTDPMQSVVDAGRPGNQGLATYYVSAIMRGFGVYTLVLAGLLVLSIELLASPSQASYLRLAPTVSIISFYAGYDPSVFAALLDRVKSFMQANNVKNN